MQYLAVDNSQAKSRTLKIVSGIFLNRVELLKKKCMGLKST